MNTVVLVILYEQELILSMWPAPDESTGKRLRKRGEGGDLC